MTSSVDKYVHTDDLITFRAYITFHALAYYITPSKESANVVYAETGHQFSVKAWLF